MLNMILNFIGNCIQEPSPEIAQKVLEETQVISVLDLFYENRSNIELTTLDYSTWIVNCIVQKVVKSEIMLVEQDLCATSNMLGQNLSITLKDEDLLLCIRLLGEMSEVHPVLIPHMATNDVIARLCGFLERSRDMTLQ